MTSIVHSTHTHIYIYLAVDITHSGPEHPMEVDPKGVALGSIIAIGQVDVSKALAACGVAIDGGTYRGKRYGRQDSRTGTVQQREQDSRGLGVSQQQSALPVVAS